MELKNPDMFSAIARRYDMLNRILSCGLDRRWRRKTAQAARLTPGSRVLDVCTGTADLALSFSEAQPRSCVTGIDLSPAMLEIGAAKINAKRCRPQIFLGRGNALDLPFEDSSFDITATAFGLRNIPDYHKGLQEMKRVTKTGGRILILEFAPPRKGLWAILLGGYLKHIVPRIGAWLNNSSQAYAYLSSSIFSFLTPTKLCRVMEEAELGEITSQPLTGGIAYLYQAKKI
jgi:demethylmenaquinone methyltransferase/2-methoxy-6-polyprenyl-1,4-benzoquinol methylase